MQYIKTHYPALLPLYADIYTDGNDAYWQTFDRELQAFAAAQGLEYKTNDDSFSRPFDAPPVMVNYFYHNKIKGIIPKGKPLTRALRAPFRSKLRGMHLLSSSQICPCKQICSWNKKIRTQG